MLKIIGVMVLYHPDRAVFSNIRSYLDCLDKLYIVDNSNIIDSEIVEQFRNIKKCHYVNNDGNQGIAHALNTGINLALADNSDWVLTMDQDSYFVPDALAGMIKRIGQLDVDHVGILSPVHKIPYKKINESDDVAEVATVMTSGNLLNIHAYKSVGGFREDFFIDYVDHEYCLRLSKWNYRVLVDNNSVLVHDLGKSERLSFFGLNVIYTSHNRIRRYYITRNRLILLKEYWRVRPIYCIKDVKYFFSSWLKIVLFDKNAIAKQKSILLGVLHFFQGKSGKLSLEGEKYLGIEKLPENKY